MPFEKVQPASPKNFVTSPTKSTMKLQLTCPNCEASIRAGDINIDMLIAKCHHCHTVFSFEDEFTKVARQRAEVPMPPGIEAYSYPSELSIEIQWRRMMSGFLTFFTIFWNLILIPFILIAIFQGEWIIFLFIALHLFVGVALAYYTIAMLLNTTYITVDRYKLIVEHKPLPVISYKDQEVTIADINQLFIEKYIASRTNGRPDFAYMVRYAKKNSSDHVTLMRGLRKHEQARYIEQEIERFLEIEDRPVEGEWLP